MTLHATMLYNMPFSLHISKGWQGIAAASYAQCESQYDAFVAITNDQMAFKTLKTRYDCEVNRDRTLRMWVQA